MCFETFLLAMLQRFTRCPNCLITGNELVGWILDSVMGYLRLLNEMLCFWKAYDTKRQDAAEGLYVIERLSADRLRTWKDVYSKRVCANEKL